MNANFLKRMWLTARIWLVALMTNTVLGTFYLADFTFDTYTMTTISFVGLAWGIPFSLPVPVVIMIVMNRCLKVGLNGLQLFWRVFITGILMSVVMYLIFIGVIGFTGETWIVVLLGLAVLSGIIAVAAHYRPLLKLGYNVKSTQENN